MSAVFRPKLVITRKPDPPPLPPFECVICERTVERDPHNPDFERAPICFRCSMRPPTRPQLAGTTVELWTEFYRAHALICAIQQEAKRARSHH